MITCPACGKENEDSAFECKRCRAPLREDMPEEHAPEPEPEPAVEAAAPAEEPAPSSDSLGEVCRRCETYNEPGVRVCTNCGFELFAEALAAAAPPPEAAAEEPPMDKTPPQAFAPPADEAPSEHTPPDGNPALSDELSALALSDEEAAEAGLSRSNGEEHAAAEEPPLDKTPPQAYAAPEPEPEPEPAPPPPPARGKGAEIAAAAATAAGAVVGAAVGIAAGRRAPEPPPPPPPPPAKAPEAAEKLCSSCGAPNPPAAKFCFDCGTPFAKKAAAPPPEPVKAAPPPPPPPPPKPEPVKPVVAKAEPPPSIQVAPSIQVDAELTESTAESAPVSLEEPLPEEEPAPVEVAEELLPEEATPSEEPIATEEPLPEEEPPAEPVEEAPPPFQASLVVEKGAAQGTAFMLAHLENRIGGTGAHIELAEDSFVAPHAATLVFAEDHLVVRDEGSANGVFVKVRESAPLEAGDLFVAGERLFRYDGPTELAKDGEGDTPFLGAPRPQGTAVRVSEVLAGGKTGRTCNRAGPVVAIGRTGCDMNFPSDSLLAARHAEIRLGEDGSATLVDLGAAPSGVFVRVKPQGQHDLHGGDILMVGDQQLRVEVG
ncbi:MAG: double zinc ribbon domain-containing protein [Myxococcales bacterium]